MILWWKYLEALVAHAKKNGQDILNHIDDKKNPLCIAIRANSLPLVTAMLKLGANPNLSLRGTAIHLSYGCYSKISKVQRMITHFTKTENTSICRLTF